MSQHSCTFSVSPKNLSDLIQLTEETDICDIVTSSLNLYHEILKMKVKKHKLAMVPIDDFGEPDYNRRIVFLED